MLAEHFPRISAALNRLFLTIIPTPLVYIFTEITPDKTQIYFTWKSILKTQRKDLNKLAISPVTIMRYMNELRVDKRFYDDFSERISLAREIEPRIGGLPPMAILEFIYAIIRDSQPEVLVETGVGAGGISLFILKALHANDRGKLYSIDLPGFDQEFYPAIGKYFDIHVPMGWDTGWLVPQNLKSRWELILGDAKSELPDLLIKLKNIDFFLHDSLHTYEHMMFEYCLAYMYSSEGAYLISDDVYPYWSLAFIDFCNAKKLQFALVDSRLGITKVYRKRDAQED